MITALATLRWLAASVEPETLAFIGLTFAIVMLAGLIVHHITAVRRFEQE